MIMIDFDDLRAGSYAVVEGGSLVAVALLRVTELGNVRVVHSRPDNRTDMWADFLELLDKALDHQPEKLDEVIAIIEPVLGGPVAAMRWIASRQRAA